MNICSSAEQTSPMYTCKAVRPIGLLDPESCGSDVAAMSRQRKMSQSLWSRDPKCEHIAWRNRKNSSKVFQQARCCDIYASIICRRISSSQRIKTSSSQKCDKIRKTNVHKKAICTTETRISFAATSCAQCQT